MHVRSCCEALLLADRSYFAVLVLWSIVTIVKHYHHELVELHLTSLGFLHYAISLSLKALFPFFTFYGTEIIVFMVKHY